MRVLDKERLGYVIVAREYRGIKQHAQAARFRLAHWFKRLCLPPEYRHRELFEHAFQRARRLKVPAKR